MSFLLKSKSGRNVDSALCAKLVRGPATSNSSPSDARNCAAVRCPQLRRCGQPTPARRVGRARMVARISATDQHRDDRKARSPSYDSGSTIFWCGRNPRFCDQVWVYVARQVRRTCVTVQRARTTLAVKTNPRFSSKFQFYGAAGLLWRRGTIPNRHPTQKCGRGKSECVE
jgi:hypothetical protein